ncbi:MAG: low molecular weight protein-tyrosine-phosphatase, partial [Pseudomonadota bacterium]
HTEGCIEVESAGTAGWHIGKPPYGPAIAAAAVRGYDMSALRAQQFLADDFEKYDLILAMDDQNLRDIEALRPSGNCTKVKLFLDFAPETGRTEIPDPYYTRDFDEALDLIEAAAQGLVKSLV